MSEKQNGPKILFLDIESTPIIAYTWGPKYEANLIEVIEQTRILSFSAKWFGGKYITRGWPAYKGYKKGALDDKAVCREMWELLNSADIVIGQNIKAFDVKIINARFLFNKLGLPAPYK